MQKTPHLYRAGSLTYTKLGLFLLFFWLLWGDFCFFMTESTTNIIPLKMKDLHCSEFLMGLILASIPRTFGAICNPIISFRSDRCRSRWGRRIPFILGSMPFLVISFIGIGYSFDIGRFIQPRLGHYIHNAGILSFLTEEMVILIVLSFFLICYDFFNTFVSSVFWYLFNDVVPEELLARFMSCFRMVIMGTSIVYNEFVFPHADIYFKEIFVGAGILYLFGFGLMCVMVKEGEYPAPPENDDGKKGFLAAAKTYARECLSLPHYWYLFLVAITGSFAGACTMFNVIFQRNVMGLTLTDIGNLAVTGAIACAIFVPISGWLADKFHPIRVVLWGMILNVITQPIGLIWLFWHASPTQFFYFTLFQTILVSCPIGMLLQMQDPPLLMRIFPRERYGQFCSARAMLGLVTGILTGGLGGAFISFLKHFLGERTAYCLIPVWVLFFNALALVFMVLLYRSWKRYGGDAHYVPPLPAHLQHNAGQCQAVETGS
jgi:maltose/moltooligosaccharide transporter